MVEPLALPEADPEAKYLVGSDVAYCGDADLALTSLGDAIAGGYCAVEALERDRLLERLCDHPGFGALGAAAAACQRAFLDGRPAVDAAR